MRNRIRGSRNVFHIVERLHARTKPREQSTPMKNSLISMGVIDEKTFTRECIIRCLRTLDDRFRIEGFLTCDECLQTVAGQDLVLYHLREDLSQWDKNKLISFKKLLSIVPVIILSGTENQNSLAQIFESGARGFIPTDNTTLEQIIEIIGLVCVGGVFVPLSSLSLSKNRGDIATAELGSSNEFTRNELAVLDRLKVGKANKIIAYELGFSESTVKVHIGRIMKKLNVTNRTQIVCRAYTLPSFRPLSLAAGPSPAGARAMLAPGLSLSDNNPGLWLDG
jgi:DNA-binding NarL/FixJ family response regulator